ncbi:hypothetical protein [Tabrizicola sp. YIM 78059]|uniref:hypothetical protein n=1 Tax=Tabrizicola sp. YIM 78059 TaxID=2529861 RepID=UPI0010AA915C|nr:hypothetical protein [Tabrizicola sp. YIM 78059]
MKASFRLALHRFPGAASCLQTRAGSAIAEGLARMDRTGATAQAKAEVCLFRLLGGLPEGMAGFTAFAEAQGFPVLPGGGSPPPPLSNRAAV